MANKDLPPQYEAQANIPRPQSTNTTPVLPNNTPISIIVKLRLRKLILAEHGHRRFGDEVKCAHGAKVLRPDSTWTEARLLLQNQSRKAFFLNSNDRGWNALRMLIDGKAVDVRDDAGWEATRPWLWRGGDLEFWCAAESSQVEGDETKPRRGNGRAA